tara:strand:+ start:1571 stop:1861 length:291 start_codon:yes stop_codon:yes gene_type:complete
MKYKLSDWEWLSLRILLLGITVFMWSFIVEIPGVDTAFGDTYAKKYTYSDIIHRIWGFRHYIYTITFSLITGVQCIKLVKWVIVTSGKKNSFEVNE